jgi:hypothetical protein
MAQTQNRDAKRPQAPTSPRTLYLTLYNLTFALLWSSILLTTLFAIPNGKLAVFDATSTRARWIQTASLVEVLHAATGTIFPHHPKLHAYKLIRNHQVPRQYHSPASYHARDPSLDGMVLLPRQHGFVVCICCACVGVERG